jgi:hypothetical protein
MEKYKNHFEIIKVDNNIDNQAKDLATIIHELCKQKLNK